jgi:hypothetical protein
MLSTVLRIADQAEAPRADRHAGDEIAEHRAELQPREDRHRDHPRREIEQELREERVIFHE